MNRLIHRAIIFELIGLLLAGCGTFSAQPDPSKFFTLSPIPQPEQFTAKEGTDSEQICLGIGPLKFPGYLDRQEIVTRTAENRLDMSENDRWAEPLDENFARVFAQNLGALLPSHRIIRYPWSNSNKPNYQIAIELLRFEVNSVRDAQLWARWEVIDPRDKTVVAVKQSRLNRHAKDRSTDAAVAALSETSAELSREIAEAVRVIAARRTAMGGKRTD